MARHITSRIKIKGKLKAKTPIHFGGSEVNPDTDLALAVNGRGNYYLAGTNLTGLLRAWMTQTAIEANIAESVINGLWGFQEKDAGHASYIFVEDGEVTLPSNLTTEIREGVGINREWGTAADRQKYNREVLPKGSAIDFDLTIERTVERYEPNKKDGSKDSQWQAEKNLLVRLLQSLKDKELRVGGGKTRGLGKVELVDITIREQPGLLTSKGMLNALKGIEKDIKLESSNETAKPAQLKIAIEWQPLTPVMQKSEGEGIAVDILPLVSGSDRSKEDKSNDNSQNLENGLSLVIAGSAIKGVLRSQAEKIVRTFSNLDLPDDFLTQLQVDLVKTLFGNAANTNTGEQQGYQGALAIDDCYSKTLFSPEQWNKIRNAEDSSKLIEALQDAGLSSMQQAYHIAIDRWTGGAADGALYSVLEPMGIQWHPLELTLDLKRLQRNKEDPDKEDPNKKDPNYLPRIALLFLVLRDLMNRRIPIGFGTNRGMGDIEIKKISFKGMKNIAGLDSSNTITITDEKLSANQADTMQRLTDAWQDWIARQGETT